MDYCRNVSVSGGLHSSEYHDQQKEQQHLSPSCSELGSGSLDDLFSCHSTEGDVSLEWLSIFMEDCLSSTGNCFSLPPVVPTSSTTTANNTKTNNKVLSEPLPSEKERVHQADTSPLQNLVIPGKARSKRIRRASNPIAKSPAPMTSWSYHHFKPTGRSLHRPQVTSSDPPLLHQAYWLADSELILPRKEDTINMIKTKDDGGAEEEGKEEEEEVRKNCLPQQQQQQQPRRCSHCLAQRTPQWRAGPLGPKTLCNACGVRYKSGRLLPEYRPAKSPTFVSYKHSNSHKKVLEMRMMALLSSVLSAIQL